ncbi:hypothetical protein NtRootA1_19860 [Arthrobacter sp. NtRootA1]|nr:hypothetical protein NtRootA1_19860 [Arthrobacter sp. NtRootA1]
MEDSCPRPALEIPLHLALDSGRLPVRCAVWDVLRGTGSMEKEGVHNVHTFRLGLPRTSAGLARIPQVSATSQQYQGRESRSSPTSGTA